MVRLAIFTTHPIQYQAPWFRALTKTSDIQPKVFFTYIPDILQQGVGFGQPFAWDIPLRDGYANEVLSERLLPRFMPAFAQRFVTGLTAALDAYSPDVAMILGWQELSLAQALWACRRRGIPIILRGESNALRSRPRVITMLHRRYFGLCDAFLAIGRSNADLYRGAGVPQSRIVTAGYFVDNERFRQSASSLRNERAALRASWGIPEKACCFAFVGKLEPKKCVLDFLRAIEIVKAQGTYIHALVVGSGEQMHLARAFANDRSLPVSFAGFMNQSEIVRAYTSADALVLPSDYGETWGLVVNEAMATGLPVIVSDRIGSANDLVIDRVSGRVFPHGDVQALAQSINEFASDEVTRLSMGAAAETRVFCEFSISKSLEGLRTAIDIAMQNKAPNGAA